MLMTTVPRLPQDVLDLRAKLSSSDLHERIDAIAPLTGLPPYSECPRPGLGGTWSFRQWCDWGKPFGFTEDEDTTHGYTMKHATGVVFSMSKTPGDYLSGYASTTQFRRKVAERLDYYASIFTALIDQAISGQISDLPETNDKNVFMQALSKKMDDSAFISKLMNDYKKNLHGATPADKVAWGSLPGVFKTLDKEFGVSVRQAMNYIGYEGMGDKVALALKHSSALPFSAVFLTHLRSYIEALRAIRVKQNEDRVKARQAEKEARTRKVSAGTKEKYDLGVNNHRAQVKTSFAAIRAVADNLSAMITRQVGNMDTIAYPEFPGAPDELNAQLDVMKTRLEEAEEERDRAKARSEEDAKTLSRLESDLVEAQAKVLHGNDELARKVLELTDLISRRLATTTDILSIGAAVKDVREASVSLGQFVRAEYPELSKAK